MQPEDNDIIELPQALVDELKARDHAVTVLTSRVDRSIETVAQAHFGAHGKPRRMPRPRVGSGRSVGAGGRPRDDARYGGR